jgi:hypothetical protein
MTGVVNLWPGSAAARVSLLSLMAFGFLIATLYASTIPPWWGPDEDYHFGYASNLSEQGKLSDPRKPFYSAEWNKAIIAMDFNQFGMHPAGPTALVGDPHAADKKFEAKYGKAERQPTGEPTRPVVHAPLYHLKAAAAMKPFSGKSVFARLWIGRFVNAFAALLIVFAGWLLAAQVFAREGPRLFVAALVATQPMINYATGTMTNDAFLVAFFVLALAVLLRVIKDPPDRRQGILAGLFVAFALLSKTSALLLVPITVGAFAVQGWRFRAQRRTVLVSLSIAAAIPAVLAGWFFAYLLLKYGSLTGALGAINSAAADGTGRTLADLPGLAGTWLKQTYSTYWMHYVYWEGPRFSLIFYVPFFVGIAGIAGFAAWSWRVWRRGRPLSDKARQAVFLLIVIALTIAPWFVADMMRNLNDNGSAFNGGRFMITNYAGAATLFAIGIGELVRRRNQLLVFALLAGISFWLSASVWKLKVLDRYFGGAGQTLGSELERASFFRPEWITQEVLGALMLLVACAAAVAWIFGVRAASAERQ